MNNNINNITDITIEEECDLLIKDEKIKKGDVRGGDNVIY